jgi:hypothetical protein
MHESLCGRSSFDTLQQWVKGLVSLEHTFLVIHGVIFIQLSRSDTAMTPSPASPVLAFSLIVLTTRSSLSSGMNNSNLAAGIR